MANYDLYISGFAFKYKCKLQTLWILQRKFAKIIMLFNPNLPCLCVYSIAKLNTAKFRKHYCFYWTIHNRPCTQQNHFLIFFLPCFFDGIGDCATSTVLFYLMTLMIMMIMMILRMTMMMMEMRMNRLISSRDLTIKDLHHRESPTRHDQDYGMHVLILVPSTTRTL